MFPWEYHGIVKILSFQFKDYKNDVAPVLPEAFSAKQLSCLNQTSSAPNLYLSKIPAQAFATMRDGERHSHLKNPSLASVINLSYYTTC